MMTAKVYLTLLVWVKSVTHEDKSVIIISISPQAAVIFLLSVRVLKVLEYNLIDFNRRKLKMAFNNLNEPQ